MLAVVAVKTEAEESPYLPDKSFTLAYELSLTRDTVGVRLIHLPSDFHQFLDLCTWEREN